MLFRSLGLLAEARAATSLDVLQALSPARGDDALRARIQAVVEGRREPKLASEFRRLFAARP